MIRILSLSFVLLLGLSSVATAAELLAGQREISSKQDETIEYRLTLSSLKNVNAQIVAEQERWIKGDLNSQTWEFDSALSKDEAWSLLERLVTSVGASELYACDGLACGASNAWANERFNNKVLYGMDASQRYRVFSLNQGQEIWVLYFVQRGNRRIYAHLDQLSLTQAAVAIVPNASALNSRVRRQGYIQLDEDLASIFIQNKASADKSLIKTQRLQAKQGQAFEYFDALVLAFKKQPLQRFYIVAHIYTEADQQANELKGRLLADQLKERLQQAGLDGKRFEVYSVGALAPRQYPPRNRIELVLR
ncbi:DUF4892 domain-containing protein [Agaribacterium sp. ZY112]|uniref:DUF4892 domain-containing protein n=1 Tax=Agaribacterium sp. ZY112 TaxID=3233574 RepID=UPI003525F6C1